VNDVIDISPLEEKAIAVNDAIREADFTPLWDELTEDLERDHAQFHAQQQGPDGEPWTVNALRTIKDKGHAKILYGHTGDLAMSVQFSDATYAIRDRIDDGEVKMLRFGTKRPWARTNQEGTRDGHIPPRPHVGLTPERRESVKTKIRAFVREIAVRALRGE
jgi:phage gpG-like protein